MKGYGPNMGNVRMICRLLRKSKVVISFCAGLVYWDMFPLRLCRAPNLGNSPRSER